VKFRILATLEVLLLSVPSAPGVQRALAPTRGELAGWLAGGGLDRVGVSVAGVRCVRRPAAPASGGARGAGGGAHCDHAQRFGGLRCARSGGVEQRQRQRQQRQHTTEHQHQQRAALPYRCPRCDAALTQQQHGAARRYGHCGKCKGK